MAYYNEHERLRPYAPRDEYVSQGHDGPEFTLGRAPPSNDPYWQPPSFRTAPDYQPFPVREEYPRGVPHEVYPRTLTSTTFTPDDILGGPLFDFGPSQDPDYGRVPSHRSFDSGHDSEYDLRRPLHDFPQSDYDRRPSHDFDHERRPQSQYAPRPPEFDSRSRPYYDQGSPPKFDRGPPSEFDLGHQPQHERSRPVDFDRRPPPPDFDRRHPSADFDRRYPPSEFDRRPPPEFDRRYPPSDFDNRSLHGHDHRPHDIDRRPEPHYGQRPPEVEHRPPPPPEVEHRPPPEVEHRPLPEVVLTPPPEVEQRHVSAEVPSDAGFQPPLPYEPEQHLNLPESPKRPASPPPPVVIYPPAPVVACPPQEFATERAISPPHPPADDVGPQFPPMPYEPDAAPQPQVETSRDIPHEHRPPDVVPQFVPPMPYEPEGRSPMHHHHDEYPDGYPPHMDLESRGVEGAVPYPMEGGPPPLHQDAYYGQVTDHGHVKKRHFQACKDYWAAFLFFLHFWAVVGVCIYLGVRGLIKSNQNEELLRAYALAPSPTPLNSESLYNIKHWAPQLAAATGAGWWFAFIWQSLIRAHPLPMIKICLCLGAVSTGLLGIILLSTGTAKGLIGLLFVAFALFQGLYVHLVRHRMEFAGIMLRRALLTVHEYKSLYVISMWTVFLAMFWLAIWIFGVSGALSFQHGGYYVALLVISLAWSMEVLRNTVNVTVASVIGTYYYEMGNMPHLPVLRSYQRAWTLSFGSVCLGSIFVTPVTTLHAIAKRLANEQGANEFLFSCVNCFLGVLEFFIKHFNKWAFVGVGLHGKSFVRSAKETWILFKEQETMLLVNDDLSGAVLLTGCIIGGVVTALVGGCWTFATHRNLTVGVSIVSFLLGFFVTYLTMVVSESAVAAYFVCFSEDPRVLAKHDPALAQYMTRRNDQLKQELED
uniref:Choline transporter-like protein n=1 Tax=Physcomitrium patens TaxID=3218 RepID=A0A7I4C734_PHYPA